VILWLLVALLPGAFLLGRLSLPRYQREIGETDGDAPPRYRVDSIVIETLERLAPQMTSEQLEATSAILRRVRVSFVRWSFLSTRPDMQGETAVKLSGSRAWILSGDGWEYRLARAVGHVAHTVARAEPDRNRQDSPWWSAVLAPWITREDGTPR